MKKYFTHPLISLKPETYLTLIIFLAPCLYFLGGINVDIYSPSMPSIAAYFHATIVETKNTISVLVLGWAIGAMCFGILIDGFGRKKILLTGMFIYVVSSVLAPFCRTIHELMFIRAVEGFSIASILIARAMIVDLLSGKRYSIAILYTSVGYGIGPVVGPFVGGLLQYYFDWQANFIALTIMSAMLFILLLLFVKESISVRHSLKFLNIMQRSFSVIKHKQFMAGVVIAGITQIQLMIYPTLGPFIVEKILHQSVLVYGNSALMVGGSFLVGSLMSRVLLKTLLPKKICDIGCIFLFMGLVMAFLFAVISPLELTTIMLPIIFTGISAGLIFPNLMSANLKTFAHSVGIAMAVQSSVLLLSTAFGLFCISHIHVTSLWQLFNIALVLTAIEIGIFYGFFRHAFSDIAH